MKRILTSTMAVNLLAGVALAATINFDDDKAGELPGSWVGGVTGMATPKCCLTILVLGANKSQ